MYMCVGVNVHLLLVCSLITQKALSPAVAAPLGWSARPNTERLHEFFMKADGERTVCVCVRFVSIREMKCGPVQVIFTYSIIRSCMFYSDVGGSI